MADSKGICKECVPKYFKRLSKDGLSLEDYRSLTEMLACANRNGVYIIYPSNKKYLEEITVTQKKDMAKKDLTVDEAIEALSKVPHVQEAVLEFMADQDTSYDDNFYDDYLSRSKIPNHLHKYIWDGEDEDKGELREDYHVEALCQKTMHVVKSNIHNDKKKESGLDMNEGNDFFDMMKDDMAKAGYRVAATQMTKLTKAGLLAALKDKGMDNAQVQSISALLDSEPGEAVVSLLLGVLLTYMPGLNEDPRVAKLAGEFRVNGMSQVGNSVMATATQYLMPAVTQAIAALPPLTEAEKKKMRVSEKEATVHRLSTKEEVEDDEPVSEETVPAKRRASK